MPPRSSKEGGEPADSSLTFVVTTNPYDGSSAANKRQVRSIAALKSWPERRRRTFEQFEGSSSPHGGFILEQGPPIARSSKRVKPTDSIDRSSRIQRSSLASLSKDAASTARGLAEAPLFEKCTRAEDENCECAHCRFERIITTYSAARSHMQQLLERTQGKKRTADGDVKVPAAQGVAKVLTPPATRTPSPYNTVNNVGRAEPFSCYPVPYRRWFDRILHHMMNVYCPRGWPVLRLSNAEGVSWERFMTLAALSEPALFYVRLLFGSGDMVRLSVLPSEVSWWLKQQAIEAMNEALADPKRATCEAIILAIGRIALYEFQYGDKDASNRIHRPAQARMVALRGGMKTLEIPEVVKRMMRWSDTVMARQTGTSRMIEDDDSSPNFSLKQTVEVLEEWVPYEGEDLRKKIKISDLLSSERDP